MTIGTREAVKRLLSFQRDILSTVAVDAQRAALHGLQTPVSLVDGTEDGELLYPSQSVIVEGVELASLIGAILNKMTNSPTVKLVAAGALLANVVREALPNDCHDDEHDDRLALALWSVSTELDSLDADSIEDDPPVPSFDEPPENDSEFVGEEFSDPESYLIDPGADSTEHYFEEDYRDPPQPDPTVSDDDMELDAEMAAQYRADRGADDLATAEDRNVPKVVLGSATEVPTEPEPNNLVSKIADRGSPYPWEPNEGDIRVTGRIANTSSGPTPKWMRPDEKGTDESA